MIFIQLIFVLFGLIRTEFVQQEFSPLPESLVCSDCHSDDCDVFYVTKNAVSNAAISVTNSLTFGYVDIKPFDVTEKDRMYGYDIAVASATVGINCGVTAVTLGAGCAAAQSSKVASAAIRVYDVLETASSARDLVNGGISLATDGLSVDGALDVVSGALGMFGIFGKSCFTEGTQIVIGVEYPAELCSCEIVTSDCHSDDCDVFYVTTNIENIKVGDLVYSYDTITGEVSQKVVTDTFVRTSNHLDYLTIVDENGNEQVIETTDSHPFWVVTNDPDLSRAASEVVIENGTVLYHENLGVTANGYWVEAKDLREGDVFLGANGEISTLVAKERVEFPDGITVYNFTVDGNHDYFVIAQTAEYGQTCILVHNAGLDYNVTPVYRGGTSFVVRDIDVIMKDGLVQPGRGVSVNLSREGLEKFGGAHRIKYIPEELEIIQYGKNKPSHFEICPKQPMTQERYQSLLDKIITD